MSFPTCLRCGNDTHSPYEACADLQELGEILTVAARPRKPDAIIPTPDTHVTRTTDRKAYMRAYMKQRRAKAKA